jgi:hypothetical protein
VYINFNNIKEKLFVIVLMIVSVNTFSQRKAELELAPGQPPIPIEIFGGVKSSMYQMTVSKQIAPESKFGFFNLINYEVDYDDAAPNSYILQTLFTYNLTNRFNVGIGANLKSFGGFRPFVSASYSIFNKNIGFLIQPIYELNKNGLIEVFSLFEWRPASNKLVTPYFRVQGLLAFKEQHSFSYHYWRAGVQFKNFRIGPALNVQYLGANLDSITNIGGFISVLIF